MKGGSRCQMTGSDEGSQIKRGSELSPCIYIKTGDWKMCCVVYSPLHVFCLLIGVQKCSCKRKHVKYRLSEILQTQTQLWFSLLSEQFLIGEILSVFYYMYSLVTTISK